MKEIICSKYYSLHPKANLEVFKDIFTHWKNIRYIIVLFSLSLIITLKTFGQTPKQVNSFPEDYLGKTITFRNIRFWPTLEEINGFYFIEIDIAPSLEDEREWGFRAFSKIIGVVGKDMAKQMINQDFGGYNKLYYGTLTGTVVKSNAIPNSEYLFIIKKVINYPPNEPNHVVRIFSTTVNSDIPKQVITSPGDKKRAVISKTNNF